MRNSWKLFSVLLLATTTLWSAEKAEIDRVIAAGRNDNKAYEYLDRLVNGIGARLTASHGERQACDWAIEELKAAGLQNVHLHKAGEFPVMFNRGPWSGKMVAPEEMALEFGTSAWSAGTRGAVTGQAALAPSTLEDASKSDWEGKWVLTQRRQRGRRNREQQREQRAITTFLKDHGIAGFVRSTGSKYVRTGGSPRIEWDNLPTTPSVNLRGDQWDKIQEMLESGKEVSLQFDIRNHFLEGPAPYFNVIADIPGSELPDEYVIFGGHIDSWDGATGTTDDGIGVATAMAAARILAESGVRPKRTIRVMLWSGEEQGLLGSRAYVDENPDLMDKISAVYVLDGGPNPVGGIGVTPAMKSQMDSVFAPVMDLDPEMPFEIKVHEAGLTGGAGSDHLSFFRHGVPAFFWNQVGPLDWRHGIHTQFDTFDLAQEDYVNHSALVVALAALGTADLDQLLSREKLTAPRGGGRGAGGRLIGVYLNDTEIEGLVPGGVAGKCGLKAGDIFLQVDGKSVTGRAGLVQAIQKGGPEKSVTVKRDGKSVKVRLIWEDEKKDAKKKKGVIL